MAKVLNQRTAKPAANQIYVGRPSQWGNPFEIGKHGTRAEVIERYREYLHTDGAHLRAIAKQELRGKDLVCWCAPLPCHADILLKIANEEDA